MKGLLISRHTVMRRRVVWPRCVRLALSAIGFSILILILTKVLAAVVGDAAADAQLEGHLALNESSHDDLVLKRGEYLVSSVAMCGQCHADPALPNGPGLDGTVTVAVALSAGIESTAPPMTGLSRWDEEDVVELLQNGRTPDGYTPRPPMPRYRFSEDDAVAVARYLKSLP